MDKLVMGQAKAETVVTDATSDWFWEGNVTDAIASYLERTGWAVLSKADTRSRQRGLDLHARRGDDRHVLIEVKGYPSANYRDPSRANEIKPTSPGLQAHHWFSHALLKAIRMQSAHPGVTVAIGLPDFPRYRTLFEETKAALERLGIAVLFVNEHREVEAFGIDLDEAD